MSEQELGYFWNGRVYSAEEAKAMSAKKQPVTPAGATWVALNKTIDSEVAKALSVKAKVVSHSRDYLTLEFIGNEPKAFAAGEIVEISKP